MSGDENLWYVKTGDGDVHRVTLDQLDEAFQAGRIDENVMVLGGGASRWTKLGQLAGLDEPPVPPPIASSLRPFSMDLSLDLDDENVFRKKSRKGLVFGTLFVALAGFAGFVALNRGHVGSYNVYNLVSAAAPAPAPAPPPAALPPVVTPDPPPPAPAPVPAATTAATPPSSVADPSASKLSDDQRAKLAAADKALDAKTKAHKKGHAGYSGGSSHGSSKGKSQGFTTGGNKFDPLNASF
jgi:hypothetical protein